MGVKVEAMKEYLFTTGHYEGVLVDAVCMWSYGTKGEELREVRCHWGVWERRDRNRVKGGGDAGSSVERV